MKNIAILTGGDSAEYDISILSANTVLQHLNPELFNGYIIHLKNNKFTALVNEKELAINKRDFTFQLNKKLISFLGLFQFSEEKAYKVKYFIFFLMDAFIIFSTVFKPAL